MNMVFICPGVSFGTLFDYDMDGRLLRPHLSVHVAKASVLLTHCLVTSEDSCQSDTMSPETLQQRCYSKHAKIEDRTTPLTTDRIGLQLEISQHIARGKTGYQCQGIIRAIPKGICRRKGCQPHCQAV